MSDLYQQTCEACRADAPHVSEEELAELIKEIPDWQPVIEDGVMKLRREFRFPDFVKAMEFANKLTEIAEEAGHHPDVLIVWGAATITWWSHEMKGLHKNDFILAARTDRLL